MAPIPEEDPFVASEQVEEPLCSTADKGPDAKSPWTRSRRLLAVAACLALVLGALTLRLQGAARPRAADFRQPVMLEATTTKKLVEENKDFWRQQWGRCVATTHGWDSKGHAVVKELTVKKNHLRVYRDGGGQCTVIFSATNSLHQDCTDGEGPPINVPGCNLTGVYSCFADVTFALLKDPGWSSIASYLTSSECHTVQAAGWSLGGVKASVFATCANYADGDSKSGIAHVDGIRITLPRVKELLTYGAAKVSAKQEPTNGQAKNGVFEGMRFWTEHEEENGEIKVDECAFVPDSGSTPSHPKMQAMRVRRTGGDLKEPVTSATLYGAGSLPAQGELKYSTIGKCVSNLHLHYGKFIGGIVSAQP